MSSVFARRAGIKRAYPVAAATVIGAVAAVFVTSAGYAVPFASAAGTSKFCGVSTFAQDNTTGAAGDLKVEVDHQETAFVNAGDVTVASVGSTVYFTDGYTVSIDSDTSARPIAGTVTEIDGDVVWVSPAVA